MAEGHRAVRVALIGCGNRGVQALGAGLAQLAAYDLVAVCDVDAVRANEAAARLGATAVTDHRQLLAKYDLDAVVVATSAKWHAPVALDAIRAGKHVLVEKPLAESAARAAELATAASAASVIGMVGYQARFTEFARRFKAEVEPIQPLQGVFTRQRGPFRQQFFFPDHYGGIMDHLTHEIHLALWLMGGAPQAVFGSIARGTLLGDETIDVANVLVELDAGRTVTLLGSMFGVQTPNVTQVVGRRGSVTSFDRRTLRVVRHAGNLQPLPAKPEDLTTTQVETAGERAVVSANAPAMDASSSAGQAGQDPTLAMLDHFAALVSGRETEQRGATLREGADAVAVTQAAVEAAQTGRRVPLASLE